MIVATLIAIIGTAASLWTLQRVRRLADRVRYLERRCDALATVANLGEPSEGASSPLAGRGIWVDIQQDHPLPIVADRLAAQLSLRDAEVRTGISSEDVTGPSDGRIVGEILCNGYADVYYQAQISVWIGDELLMTLRSRPEGGDRPDNLAMELVAEIEEKLTTSERRTERQRALQELHRLN